MKALLNSDLIKKSIKDLVRLRSEYRSALFELKMKNVVRSLKETHKIRLTRRNIARINTAISGIAWA